MRDRIRATRHALLAAAAACAVLLVSACATIAPTSSSPAPTATSSLPNLQRIHLKNFQASDIVPIAHGMLLLGTPGATGEPHDVPEEFGGRPKGLYYYDFATSVISTVVSISNTENVILLSETGAGDWVVYATGAPPEDIASDQPEELWAANMTTHERIRLDTTATSHGVHPQDIRGFGTDGNIAVWCSWVRNDNVNPGGSAELNIYDFKTHEQRTLLKVSMPSSASFLHLNPVGFLQGKILYGEFITPLPDQIKSYPQDGLYWLNIATGASQRLSSSAVSSGVLGGQYVVWENQQPQSLGLYDIKTNNVKAVWTTACIRPDIADDGSYVACLDYQNHLAMLIQVRSGAQTTLGRTSINARGTIANGRVYWLVPVGYTQFGTEVDAWPLPSR